MNDNMKYLYLAFVKYNIDVDTMCNDFVCINKDFASMRAVTAGPRTVKRIDDIQVDGRDFAKRFRWKK